MIVPQYWAESKIKKIINGRHFTLKRFGWSDVSEDEAKTNADIRLQEAVKTLESEGSVRRIDHKVPYNGAEGIPIREEIISRHQDVVITRNSYGARCLNVADVLFADVDFAYQTPFLISALSFIVLAAVAIFVGLNMSSWRVLLGLLIGVIIFTPLLAYAVDKSLLMLAGGQEKRRLKHIAKVSAENPDLHIRLYRTPLGLRVLLMDDIYDPASDVSATILNGFNSDPLYVRMCKNQHCFRARVSPKPWRIGVERLTPRPGVWPISSDLLADRARWVKEYEESSINYSSCQFLMTLGSDKVHEKAEFVRRLHDDMCKVFRNDLKIA